MNDYYKQFGKGAQLASIQAWILFILFLNTAISCSFEIDGIKAVITAFKSSSVYGQEEIYFVSDGPMSSSKTNIVLLS